MANIHDGGINFYPEFTGHEDNLPPAYPVVYIPEDEYRNAVGIPTPRYVRPAETPIVISEADEFMIQVRSHLNYRPS